MPQLPGPGAADRWPSRAPRFAIRLPPPWPRMPRRRRESPQLPVGVCPRTPSRNRLETPARGRQFCAVDGLTPVITHRGDDGDYRGSFVMNSNGKSESTGVIGAEPLPRTTLCDAWT
jgi:hypothetical protein